MIQNEHILIVQIILFWSFWFGVYYANKQSMVHDKNLVALIEKLFLRIQELEEKINDN